MDYYFWVRSRRIKPDAREQFEQVWRPDEFPDGLVGAAHGGRLPLSVLGLAASP